MKIKAKKYLLFIFVIVISTSFSFNAFAVNNYNPLDAEPGITSLVQTYSDESSITIEWSPVKSATGYIIYRCYYYEADRYNKNSDINYGDTDPYEKIAETVECEYTDTGLDYSHYYSYLIKPYINIDGQIITGLNNPTITASTSPLPVNTESIKKTTNNSVELFWNAENDYEFSFAVYRSPGDKDDFKLIKELTDDPYEYQYYNEDYDPIGYHYIDNTVLPGREYKYIIKTITYGFNYEKNYSRPSSILKAVTKIKKVTNLRKKSASKTSVTLAWSKIKNISGYEIYKKTASTDNYKLIKTINSNKATFTDRNLISGKPYKYKVRAFNLFNFKKIDGKFSNSKTFRSNVRPPAKTRFIKLNVKHGQRIWASGKLKKIKCSGYEIKFSQNNSHFDVPGTLRFKSPKFKFELVEYPRCYFKVRTYKIVYGKKYYSSWSKIKKVTY